MSLAAGWQETGLFSELTTKHTACIEISTGFKYSQFD